MNTEKRNCKECGVEFDYEPLYITDKDKTEGTDFMAGHEVCDPCMDKAEEKARLKVIQREDEKRARVAKARWEKVVPVSYRETDVNHPNFQKSIFKAGKRWVGGEGVGKDEKKLHFGLIGESGKGKTRVISQMVKLILWLGHKVEWVNATQFQWCSQMQFDSTEGKKARDWIARYRETEYLVFDDIGKQRWTDQVEAMFYDLLENRSSHNRPILWSSNADLQKLPQMLSDDRGQPIVGRLIDYTNIIQL